MTDKKVDLMSENELRLEVRQLRHILKQIYRAVTEGQMVSRAYKAQVIIEKAGVLEVEG